MRFLGTGIPRSPPILTGMEFRTSSWASGCTRIKRLQRSNPFGQSVFYWYRTVRNPKAPGGAEFIPELIHNRSGAGSIL